MGCRVNNQNVLDTCSDYDYSQDFGAIEKYYADTVDNDTDSNRIVLIVKKLPWWNEEVRCVPNMILRSALFGVIKKGKREYVENQVIYTAGKTTILYTGKQLDQTDLSVWEQCVHLGRNHDLNKPIYFSCRSFLKSVGKKVGKSQYDLIKKSIDRLVKGSVTIKQGPTGYTGHFVDSWGWDTNKNRYKLRLNPEITALFGENMYTKIDDEKRKKMGGSLHLWLYRFYSSHKKPFPIKVETVKELCGSKDTLKSFRYCLKKAIAKLSIITGWTCWIADDKVFVKKTIEVTAQPKKTSKTKDSIYCCQHQNFDVLNDFESQDLPF